MQTISEIKKAFKEKRLLIRKKDRDVNKRQVDCEWFKPALWRPEILPQYETLIFDTEDNRLLFSVQLHNEYMKTHYGFGNVESSESFEQRKAQANEITINVVHRIINDIKNI